MIAISIIMGAITALVAYEVLTWTPEAAEGEPHSVAVAMALDYVEQLEQLGIEATLVECVRIDTAPISRDRYACSLLISGEVRRIDCNANAGSGCYPSAAE